MSALKKRFTNALKKKLRRGNRGYPVATVAFYGPDNSRASKVAVGIIAAEGGDVKVMKRWYSDQSDVRSDQAIVQEILNFINEQAVRSVVGVNRLIGCPHEEGIDYPSGQVCPKCPYWAHRNRFTGQIEL